MMELGLFTLHPAVVGARYPPGRLAYGRLGSAEAALDVVDQHGAQDAGHLLQH
jgi:hypothetical protein